MSRLLVKTGRCLVSSPLWMTRSQPKTQLLRSVTTTTSVPFHQNTAQQQTNNFTNQQQHQHQHQQHVQLQKASFHSSLSRQQEQNTNASKHYPTVTFSSPKLTELFDRIVYLDLVEIHLLTEILNQKMGITLTDADRANMAAGGGGGGAGGGGAAAEEAPKEEKTAFDLKLTGFDAKAKIKVIKEVRAMTGLGLKEAKEMVEGAPKVLKKELKKEEAEELKAKLEAVGATVELA